MTRTERGARIVAGSAMIAAPATLLAAAILHPPHAGTDAEAWFEAALAGRQRFYAAQNEAS